MAARKIPAGTIDPLKDEVYRQMLRLEAGHASARPLLGVALLRAWMALEQMPLQCEARQWLRKLSPLCVGMMLESCTWDGHASHAQERPIQ